jgi:hypothetical protein
MTVITEPCKRSDKTSFSYSATLNLVEMEKNKAFIYE